MSSTDDLPPALSSMWRAVKRGYEAEPWLLTVAFGLSLLSALPDALLALWLKLLADGVVGACHVVSPRHQRSHAAPLPRSGDDRARIARGSPSGVGCDDRAP
jgi:hypothetical protein